LSSFTAPCPPSGTSFGKLLPSMAMTHRVVAIEQQAHGHTPDINRPLTCAQMADDTVALLRELAKAGVR
jgi:pimeloyl-ACP methyl ester carboxylesterase